MEACKRHLLISVLLLAGLAVEAEANPRKIYDRHSASVVAITYYVETHFMRQVREVEGREVGVLVGDDLVMLNGIVITSSSTGARPHTFRVHFQGGAVLPAAYIGRDEFANVAFLRVEGELPEEARPLEFDPRAKVRVGDEVYVLGLLPENLHPMVRISAGRIVAHVREPKSFLVTDLPPDEALGGPVFSASGKVLGVLSELGGAGPAFAAGFGGAEQGYYGIILTAHTLQPLIDDPPRRGEVRRAWLGITLQALTPDMSEYWGLTARSGIIVNSVIPGSPANAAGLQEGDLVVGINGGPIPVSQEDHVPIFVEQVGSSGVGSELQLDVIRDGAPLRLEVVLAAAPKSRLDAEQYNSPEFELTVRELVFSDYRAFDLDPGFVGVLVSRVKNGGWSGIGGLQPGDIIQRVDEQAIRAPEDLKRVLEAAIDNESRKLVFFVQRGRRTQFITVQPNWEES
jgi:serine protease Do